MSKMSDWVLNLEQDKIELSRSQFTAKHGEMFGYIWDEQLGIVRNNNQNQTDFCYNTKV